MHEERTDFAAKYAEMNEGELMGLARTYDSLVADAQTALRAEFARRRLEPPLIDEAADDSVAERKLVTVARFGDLGEAGIAQSVLESAGISSFLQDENIARIYWGAIGGARLQVDAADAQIAMELLNRHAPQLVKDSGE